MQVLKLADAAGMFRAVYAGGFERCKSTGSGDESADEISCSALRTADLYLRHIMQVHRHMNQLPAFRNAIVTIGTFDGVHTGHQQIIHQMKEEAHRLHGETVIITFHPHPRKIVSSHNIHILNTLEEKAALLEAQGVDHLVVVPFDAGFAQQPADAYVQDFLYHYFKPKMVIIGYDHRFGKGRSGDYHLMEAYGSKLGFYIREIPEHVLNNVTVSSTRIRGALLHGDIAAANNYLGYAYFFSGLVVEGNKLGRTIGFPTANLQPVDQEKLVPGNGVYAVTVTIAGEPGEPVYRGMMNIGIRPTVDGTHRVIEVHLLHFDRDIYGKTLCVSLHAFLRQEIKFNGLDALKSQLEKDKQATLQALQ